MDIGNAFPSKYLKSSDLKGRAIPVVMGDVVTEKVGDDEKPCLYFRGKDKGIVLNRINSDVIAEAYGAETDNWAGQSLELYPDKTQFNGKVVDCIRVRKPLPAVAEGDGDIPF